MLMKRWRRGLSETILRSASVSELGGNLRDLLHLQVLLQTMEIATPAPGIAKQDLKKTTLATPGAWLEKCREPSA